jgi:hypothetical protein
MNSKIEKRLHDLGMWYREEYDGSMNRLVIYPECKYRRDTVYFECPFCVNKYKLNGNPYKYAKPVIHTHGRGDNWGERSPHCSTQAREQYGLKCYSFEILPPNFTLSFK